MSLLYDHGKFLGSQMAKYLGLKKEVTITLDQTNGTDTGDGITEPTNSWLRVLSQTTKYLNSQVKVINSPNPVSYNASTLHSGLNQIIFDSTANGNNFSITFSILNGVNNTYTISKLVFENCKKIEFRDFRFVIDPSLDFNVNTPLFSIPFVFKNTTVSFHNCEFVFQPTDGTKQAVLLWLDSSIVY